MGVQSPEVEGPGDGDGEVEGVEPAVNLPEIHCRTWRPHGRDIKAIISRRINRSQEKKKKAVRTVLASPQTTNHSPVHPRVK